MSESLPVLYVKTGCPWCEEVEEYLEEHRIEVKQVVVTGDEAAMREMTALSGQTKAPVLDWHGSLLVDFGVDELVPFLREQGVGGA